MHHAVLMSIDRAVCKHCVSNDAPDLPTAHASDLATSNNVSEVVESARTYVWRHSMEKVLGGLLQGGTIASTPAWQRDANIIDAKWLFTRKTNEYGWVRETSSRLLAHGFEQREGTDAPIVSSSSFCRLSAMIAVACDLDLCHFDVG